MRAKARQTSRVGARVALAFAYDGSAFDSFARQPGRRTVEGELLRILRGGAVIGSARAAHYEVASRTDAGVSAAWNVCAFDTGVDARRVAHIKHDVVGLWLLSAVSVPLGFSPRRQALSKRYVYHVPEAGHRDRANISKAARLFVGRHDFRNYCRPDRGVPTERTLTSVRVERGRFVFEAPGFLWEQVRRISQALLDVGGGKASLASVRAALDGSGRVAPQRPAPAQDLVLEDVRLDIGFPPASKATMARIRAARDQARSRLRFYDLLDASVPTPRR